MMEQLKEFIQEKLILNKKLKSKAIYRKNWSIETAENGDIVSWNDDTLIFIYKCLNNGDNKINSTPENSIVYHAAWIPDGRNILYVGIDTGVGDTSKPHSFKLASEDMCEKFYKELEKKGYKWDNIKKEIVKI